MAPHVHDFPDSPTSLITQFRRSLWRHLNENTCEVRVVVGDPVGVVVIRYADLIFPKRWTPS